jgi:hypothetical protein
MLQWTGIIVLFLAVAQPSLAQRKQKVDPGSESAKACRQFVKAKVSQEYPNAQQVHVNLDTAVEWQENEVEIFITGRGRFERRSGNWREFEYRCIYYLRTETVTVADVELGTGDSDPDDGAGDFGVTLYRDLGFRGVSETFIKDRTDLRGNPIGDDQTTSVRVSRGCMARLYQDPDFRGPYVEITSDVSDLRGSRVGDDAVTSVRVRCDGQGWGDDSGSPPPDEWEDDPFNYGVTLFRDPDFRGPGQTFSTDNPDLRGSRIGDDQATSVRISRGCQARLFQDLNYRGVYTEVTADVPHLQGSRVGDDSVTSLQVRCDR